MLHLFALLLLLAVSGASAQSDDSWQQIPVDNAVCARGEPYSFFVHQGDPHKLMVYFQGGGACWGDDTCKVGGTFDDSVAPNELDRYRGIFDFDNPQNPVADYSMVVVAYCTGDVHTGSSEQDFTDDRAAFAIHFDGFANAQAALNWTFSHFEPPNQLIVTGSSAGAYGAIFNAPYVLAHYPNARAVVFGDAGIGVTAPDWDGLTTWGTLDNLFSGTGYDGVSSGTGFGNTLYQAAARAFPDARFAQYTSAADAVQTGFYLLQGGEADWSAEMQARIAELDELSNFNAYIGWGGTHTVLATPLFYTMQVGGVSFRDWFADLIGGEDVANVACDDCLTPELAGE
ncbi:MAG: pectin acetylesterase-family hydrolase [Chloroflexota bacterium]